MNMSTEISEYNEYKKSTS